MCIISIKAKGIKIPSEETFRTMWRNNDDGAGFMYSFNNKVFIKKGFMKLSEFLTAIEELPSQLKVKDLTDVPMIYHFRIGTAGGNIAANTHPFPITENITLLQKLALSTDVGVAHNGIIHSVTPRTGISDTMEYIATQMALLKKINKKFYQQQVFQTLMENAVESKLAFLDSSGKIYTIGKFETDEETGIVYSNSTYKGFRYTSSSYYSSKYLHQSSLGCYSEYWDDEDYDYGSYAEGLINHGYDTPLLTSSSTLKPLGPWGIGEVEDLMFLHEGCFIRSWDNGDFFSENITDFAIDRNGHVYWVDTVNEVAVYWENYSAYEVSGMAAKYDESEEFPMECITYEIYTDYFEDGDYDFQEDNETVDEPNVETTEEKKEITENLETDFSSEEMEVLNAYVNDKSGNIKYQELVKKKGEAQVIKVLSSAFNKLRQKYFK